MNLITENELEQLTLGILRDNLGYETLFGPVLKQTLIV